MFITQSEEYGTRVALAATLGAILTTFMPHDSRANILSSQATRSTLEQTLNKSGGKTIAVDEASNAFGVAAKQMQDETMKSMDALEGIILDDIKSLDQRLNELSPHDHVKGI